MSDLKDAKNELINTITTDAGILAWLNTIFGKAKTFTVIEGQLEVKKISGSEFPVFIIEMADGELDAPMIGDTSQTVEGDLFEFSIGWTYHERDSLLNQRIDLIKLVQAALSGNKKLNNGSVNTVDYCRLSGYENDKSIFYPDHFMNFIVHIEININ